MFETFANALAFGVLGLDPSSQAGAAVQFFIMDVAKIFVLLFVVIYAMGLAVGTTLALMMSVAALSLPEMLILRKVIQWQALALFAAVLAVAFTLVGWGFNAIV